VSKILAGLLGTLILAQGVRAQQSNVTVPVPGDVIPDFSNGRPALFFDARTTGFTRDGKQQIFDGDVIAIGSRSIVTADKVTVDQQNHKMIAEGHVVILAADQILIGDRIDYLLDTGDFKILGAKMIVNDKAEAERISKEVLGFSPQELSFETHRKSRLDEIAKNKDELRQSVRRKVKTGKDADEADIRDYARFLEQEDLVNGQENPAFAHMTEARRNTLRKRRDFWEQSKVSERVQSDPGRQSYFRLEGDELTRVNGNDFNARHSLWTPCRCDADEEPAWGVRAATTEAQMGGYATFYDAMLEIKGMPILYLPWLKIPIKDRRQSGLLMPTFSEDAVSGSGYSQPLFLDLGPDRDATLKGDIFERRGLRAGGEFRWKRRQYSGLQLNVEGMRDRIWLKQRANRRDLMEMYQDGLDVARQTATGSAESDLSGYQGREFTRQRLAQRSWWESHAKECLSADTVERQACEDSLANATRAPKNANRGLAKWKAYDRLGERTAFVTSGELYSDRQYNADVYLPDAMQPGFDSGSGERGINPARSRVTYDGSDYFLGLGSYWGDPSRLDDRFEGYQLPAQVQARSRWISVKSSGVPIYARVGTDYSRILRDPGTPEDTEFRKDWIPGGSWRRGEISIVAPVSERTAVQVNHFTDLEGRGMMFDGKSSDEKRSLESSLMSWRTGFRFQLPIDGRATLPGWLGGFSNESGQRVIQHIMNWSMTLTTRPMVRRRGPYGKDNTDFSGSPRTWFATDRAGSDDNISATEFMNEYQIVSFGTSHRWKLFNETWNAIRGVENPAKSKNDKTMSYEEKARRDLLYTMDHPVRGASDIFSKDQKQWFGDRYQLLETDYTEPLTFDAGISYDRLKDVRRARDGKTRDNRPWSEADSSMGLNVSGWSLGASSKYNIYDKAQTKLGSSLVPPGFAKSNVSMGYTIEKSPYTTSSGGLGYIVTREKSVTLVTSLTSPVTSSWSYSRKEKENEAPARDYRQKLNLVYGSTSGCWGLGFAREKGYGVDESGASYLLQFNMTFMGQTRDLPNMSSSIEREIKKS
jgi:lipopolysaccharide export system protein LptA